jgi:hypothetical protein
MKKLFDLSALVSPRVLLGVGLVTVTSFFGGTGCSTGYSLTGIDVQPTQACVYPGTTAQFKAYGTFTEGNHSARIADISDQVTWSTSLPDLATVSTSGLATSTGNYVGNTPVIATTNGEFGFLTNSGNLVVSATCVTSSIAKPFSLNIIPGNQNLTVGQTLQPLAIATYSNNGSPADLSRQVTWESSDASVATVDASGLIAAVGAGDAVITARARTADGAIVTATQTVHLQADSQ